MSQTFQLGGRAFVQARLTKLSHDIYFARLMAAAGFNDAPMLKGEAVHDYGVRMLRKLMDSGKMLAALSCLIVPAELEIRAPIPWWRRGLEALRIVQSRPCLTGWTEEVAAETERHLGDLTSGKDKDLVFELVGELLFPFFASGTRSWASSLRSSMQTATSGELAAEMSATLLPAGPTVESTISAAGTP